MPSALEQAAVDASLTILDSSTPLDIARSHDTRSVDPHPSVLLSTNPRLHLLIAVLRI